MLQEADLFGRRMLTHFSKHALVDVVLVPRAQFCADKENRPRSIAKVPGTFSIFSTPLRKLHRTNVFLLAVRYKE